MEVMEDETQPQTHNQTQTQNQNQTQTETQNPSSPRSPYLERNEPVRSRWTPKPEQILILESIFNSGMVNPPKEETVKIRKLLEKFGSVGDANVFYWFQNRRSRSRRRQRQIQASLVSSSSLTVQHQQSQMLGDGDGDAAYNTAGPGFVTQQPAAGFFPMLPSLSPLIAASSSRNIGAGRDDLYSASSFAEIEQNTSLPSSFLHLDTSKVHCEFASGVITVFINGVPTEVESGPFNMKSMFGDDFMLVHSSGMPVPLDEYGFSLPGLQHGESYFLVSRSI